MTEISLVDFADQAGKKFASGRAGGIGGDGAGAESLGGSGSGSGGSEVGAWGACYSDSMGPRSSPMMRRISTHRSSYMAATPPWMLGSDGPASLTITACPEARAPFALLICFGSSKRSSTKTGGSIFRPAWKSTPDLLIFMMVPFDQASSPTLRK